MRHFVSMQYILTHNWGQKRCLTLVHYILLHSGNWNVVSEMQNIIWYSDGLNKTNKQRNNYYERDDSVYVTLAISQLLTLV